jgi:6-phosphogluconolactonase (cycloisomerase 2 family)
MNKQIKLLALLAASAAMAFSSCKKDDNIATPESATGTPDYSEKGANPDEADLAPDAVERNCRPGGYLYTESNATSQNEILCYKIHSDGSLTLEATVASGGNGVGAGPLGLGLDSQGALALSDNNEWLFAVNGGSNSISSFKVHNDGSITLMDTKSSGGNLPTSLCIHGRVLYVLNNGSSDINGYMVGQGGILTAIPNTNLPLSATMADPAQIAFSPNGDYLYVTERMTDKITSYDVDMNGVATFDMAHSSTGHTPFGFCHARDNYMVVSNANVIAPGVPVPNGSSCTSYGGSNSGNLSPQNGAVANNQSAACWVATTKYGRFAYDTNTGSNSISSYYVSPWGSIYLIHGAAAMGNAPKDIVVAPNNYYVYAINSAAPQSIGGYHRAFLGDLASIGNTPNLPAYAAGLVCW